MCVFFSGWGYIHIYTLTKASTLTHTYQTTTTSIKLNNRTASTLTLTHTQNQNKIQDGALRGVPDLDTLAIRLQRKRAGPYAYYVISFIFLPFFHVIIAVLLIQIHHVQKCNPPPCLPHHTSLHFIVSSHHRAGRHLQGLPLRPAPAALHRCAFCLYICVCVHIMSVYTLCLVY